MITGSIITQFPIPTDLAFKYLVYSLECDKWMEDEDWQGTFFYVGNKKITGIEFSNPDQRMGPLFFPVHEIIENEKVILGPSIADTKNVHADSRLLFPFREMWQGIYLEETTYGCKVTHTISFKPKWFIGWITSRFLVLPKVKKLMVLTNKKLINYLNESA